MRSKWVVLTVVQLGVLLCSIDGSSVFFALPAIAADLKLKISEIQWVSVAYTITAGAALPLAGKIADAIGRKRAYLLGFAIFTASSVISGLVSTLGPLIATRVFTALGTAFLLSSSNVITMAVFPKQQHGLALGIGATVFSLGVGVGLSLGGLLLHYASWRWIFLINLPIGLFALAAGSWIFDAAVIGKGRPRTKPLDIRGALSLLVGLSSLLLGFQLVSAHSTMQGGLFLFIALAAAFVFVTSQRPDQDLVLPLSLFRITEIRVGSITRIIMRMAVSGASFTLTFYLQRNLGLRPLAAGGLMLAYVVMFAVAGPIAGHSSDRWGARRLINSGLALLTLGIALHLLLPVGQVTPGRGLFMLVIVAQATVGIGAALFGSPNTSLAMQSVPASERGVTSGVLWTTSFVGQAFGATLAAIILNAGSTTGGLILHQRVVYGTLATLLAGALWLSAKTHSSAPEPAAKPALV